MRPHSPRKDAVVTSLIALLAIVLVALGAGRVLGPVMTASDGRWEQQPDQQTTPPETATETGSATPPVVPPTSGGSDWLGTVLIVLAVLAGVAVLLLIGWILWRARALRRPEREEPEAPPEQEMLEVEEAQRALHRAIASLDYAATPEDAVVQAWLALESGIAEAGISRRENQTTTEYVVDVLADLDLPARDLRTLADLYRQALFDRAGVADDGRDRAREILRRLGESLRESTDEGAPR
ncbi:hypothetical protein DEO23_03420 [Brachybacterium endophyticum]|uniref:Protein-glutamine gamma-glutamyltransferase-like C-terminal domain-containing protein n=1 Tax=Brachybacterium endophyticum TaxID=2182385 RepID=A0A2U2RPJ6_9MICO|nr:DUF4129 domain-containing protein [Brachybacterium endophyticum]PWH07684.1 hypothetical protein DEO23_03420 [Brachybacterium endophyticum]